MSRPPATVLDWFTGIDAAQWSAAAAWLTAIVAVIASIAAFRQLGEARRLRLAQAAPYVVAYMELNPTSQVMVDFVVKNLGATAAIDVQVVLEPPLRRTAGAEGEESEPVQIPTSIPVLVPGQEYRTLWDSAITRHGTTLPDRHEAVVTFKDSRGEASDPFRFVLDWGTLWDRHLVTQRGVHDVAEALRGINKTVRGWSEGVGAKGVGVYVRDGDARDQRARAAQEERLARRREETAAPETLADDPPGRDASDDSG
jgi:hypothetical protein